MPREKNTSMVPDHINLDADWQVVLGKGIRRVRESEGWTILDLAGLLDTSFQYIGAIENGHKTPSTQLLLMMMRALCSDADAILGPLLTKNGDESVSIALPKSSRYHELSSSQKARLNTIIDEAIEGFLEGK